MQLSLWRIGLKNYFQLNKSIDEVAIEGRKTIAARSLFAVIAAVLIGFNFNPNIALMWLSINFLGEYSAHICTKNMSPTQPGTFLQRLNYLFSVTIMTSCWTAVAVLYWFKYETGFQITAVLCLATQLMHAQAFTFQSSSVLAITGGMPAAAIITFLLFLGETTGLEGVTLFVALVLTLGYVSAGALANLKSSQALARVQKELETIAYLDPLTGLPNRRMFMEELRCMIQSSTAEGTQFALLFIDLDKFKMINDTFGHDAGDAMLVAASGHLRNALPAGGKANRLGGDEFAVLFPFNERSSAVDDVCNIIIDNFAHPMFFKSTYLDSKPSIGVAIFPKDGITSEELCKLADINLYNTKRKGGNSWSNT